MFHSDNGVRVSASPTTDTKLKGTMIFCRTRNYHYVQVQVHDTFLQIQAMFFFVNLQSNYKS